MNDFDRYLELELRRMLDPVVASGPPHRRRRTNAFGSPLLLVMTAPIERVAEMLPAVEPAPVPVPTR